MTKYYNVLDEKVNNAIEILTSNYGAPQISKELGLFFDSKKGTLHVQIFPTTIYLNFLKTKPIGESIPLRVRDLTNLLKILRDLDIHKGCVGKITRLNFSKQNQRAVSLVLGSFIGNYIEMEEQFPKDEIKDLEQLSKEIHPDEFDILRSKHKREIIVDNYYCFAEKVHEFFDEVCTTENSQNATKRELVQSKSNNYSYFHSFITKYFGFDFLKKCSIPKELTYWSPTSIVAPFYNSSSTLLGYLESIANQDLTEKQFTELEVILIDDGSKENLYNHFKKLRKKYPFEIRHVRFEKNVGLGKVREVGTQIASKENILYLDSDILLPNNYLITMSTISRLVPNSVLVSMKKM